MGWTIRAMTLGFGVFFLTLPTSVGYAEDLSEVAAKAEEAALAGHNAWMLTSCALVLFMTAPGLAMFYGGLVRKKNVLSVMMQCLFLMGLMTVLWALYGYSLSFGEGNAFIGNTDYLFMNDVQRFWNEETNAPETPMADAIPRYTHMLFQGMFFIITPALICGAFAERMKFSAMVLFSVLWGTFVYCPLCHMVWGGGWLAFGGDESLMGGALDFAGGTVVHISSGISALICALMIGKRDGFGSADLRPHNLTYTSLGAAMLWVGWFGFNAGSELASDGLASSAFCSDSLLCGSRCLRLVSLRMACPRQAKCVGRCFGSRRRVGLHHPSGRFCSSNAGSNYGCCSRCCVRHCLWQCEGQAGL